jgi:hypothetical protein
VGRAVRGHHPQARNGVTWWAASASIGVDRFEVAGDLLALPDHPADLGRRHHQRDQGAHRQLRKAIKSKGHFPTEDAARKPIYLTVTNAVPQWTRCPNWATALLAFKIHFGDRLPDSAN